MFARNAIRFDFEPASNLFFHPAAVDQSNRLRELWKLLDTDSPNAGFIEDHFTGFFQADPLN